MNVLAGLASLAALSLFLAHLLRRSSALMPLVALAAAMLFFTAAGSLGFLYVAGWVWYALCAAALAAVFILNKGRILKLITPGIVFFVVAGVFVVVLLAVTRPMLTHWDEFTFWGTAARATSGANELYTTAHSNLIARTQPPGLIVYSYMMQFFGGFTEHGLMASLAILYFACFAAAGALWGKYPAASVVFFAAMVLLPFFFETNWPPGQMLWAYVLCMADLPLAALFGGALCLYYGGGEKGVRLMLPFALVLGALVCTKDMGLALALVALAVAGLDMLLVERRRLGFYKLRRWAALGLHVVVCAAVVAGAYLIWAWHLSTTGVNRFDVGSSAGPEMDMFTLLKTGVLALFGTGRTEAFDTVAGGMLRALWERPVCLFGPGLVVLGIILVVSGFAFGLGKGRHRLRVLFFTLAMALGFCAYTIFLIFTYTFIFRPVEGLVLKDYARYMLPYWMGWLMGALCLVGQAAGYEKATFYRLRVARLCGVALCAALVAGTLLRGGWRGNFLRISPTQYTQRHSVAAVLRDAAAEGMDENDVVYILSQGDNGSRFYIFGYEMAATRSLVYSGDLLEQDGTPITDEAGQPIMSANVASTLIPPGGEHHNPTSFECTPEILADFLLMEGCTHLLLDAVDAYIVEGFAELFSDGLAGWDADDPTVRGHRYYRVEQGASGVVLVPQAGGGAP